MFSCDKCEKKSEKLKLIEGAWCCAWCRPAEPIKLEGAVSITIDGSECSPVSGRFFQQLVRPSQARTHVALGDFIHDSIIEVEPGDLATHIRAFHEQVRELLMMWEPVGDARHKIKVLT